LGSEMGLYRISYETLKASGIGIDGIDPATLKVLVGGEEVALFVTAWRGPMKAGDFVLFYAPESAGEKGCEIRTGENALRMEEVYAAPADGEGAVWYGTADDTGKLSFQTSEDIARYLLMGFADDVVYVLDVTDAEAPKLLYGYAWLTQGAETGVYLSYFAAETASLVGISDPAVAEVEKVLLP
jgi:hypothetical protein